MLTVSFLVKFMRSYPSSEKALVPEVFECTPSKTLTDATMSSVYARESTPHMR